MKNVETQERKLEERRKRFKEDREKFEDEQDVCNICFSVNIYFSKFFDIFKICYDHNRITLNKQVSRIMRKPTFCICKNKDADQLRGNCKADQRLCFRFIDSTIPLLPKYEISSF